MKRIHRAIIFGVIFLVSLLLLIGTVRGQRGDPIYFQNDYDTKVGGPYEGSNSSSRYALTIAMAGNHTVFLNKTLARFASPDVSFSNGRFFSLFTPGVSIVGVPFYMLGSLIGFPQLVTYLSTLLVALGNLFLVTCLAKKLGAGFYSSLISGFLFTFATNALPYSGTYTQHHLSVFFILLAYLNALEERTLLRNIVFGLYAGAALLMDIPNLILLIPAGIYILSKHVLVIKQMQKIKFSFKLSVIGLLIGIIPLLIVFVQYNKITTGSYTKLAQTVGRTDFFNTVKDRPISKGEIVLKFPFDTRKELSGAYTLLISDERSWLYYSPIVLLGILGYILAYKNQKTKIIAVLGTSIIMLNILLYSMFGDPWGGWAFGPRYLIPSAALLIAGIGVAIERYKKNIPFIIIFFLLSFYSLSVSMLGAITTNQIPPKVEADNLSSPIPHTYEYNKQFIEKNITSSLIYNLFLVNTTSVTIYYISLIIGSSFMLTLLYIQDLIFQKGKVKIA